MTPDQPSTNTTSPRSWEGMESLVPMDCWIQGDALSYGQDHQARANFRSCDGAVAVLELPAVALAPSRAVRPVLAIVRASRFFQTEM